MNFGALFLASDGRLRATWRAVLFLPLFVVSLLALGFVLVAVVGTDSLQGSFEVGALWGGVIEVAGALAVSWLLLRAIDQRSFRTLGIWFYSDWGRELGLGFLFGVILNSLVVAGLVLSGQVRLSWAGLDPAAVLQALAWNLLVLTFAAAAEELLFRGYPFQRLVEGWGQVWPVLVLSAFFGAAHMGNPAATILSTVNVVLAGVLLALAYLRTRALWFPIGLHISWNYVMAAVYSLPVSGYVLEQKPLDYEVVGPEWLSGGGFGPEGSVLATAVLLGAVGWLARTRRISVSLEHQRELELHPIGDIEGKSP